MLSSNNIIYTFLFSILILDISCNAVIKEDTNPDTIKAQNTKEEYIGWWIYGEEQHIFKDEESLGEWEIVFINENIEQIKKLYLSITEMEYFPMECRMIGEKEINTLTKQSILYVADFEILYVQGCGDIKNVSE